MIGLPVRSNYLETNENKNKNTQNLWDTAKEVLRGQFTALQAYLKKHEKSQINNLGVHLKELEKTTTTTNKAQNKEKEGNNKDQSRNKHNSV